MTGSAGGDPGPKGLFFAIKSFTETIDRVGIWTMEQIELLYQC